MSNGTQSAMRSKILRGVLTVVGGYVVAAIFVPVGLALLPDATQNSFSDAEVGWLVFLIGTALSALVFWVTRSRQR
ncbi:hypothetical protein [Streptomyces sp. NPDC026673]|uniref:hypothetical protein n=1 Tax=Streptomyces sp. NPDC026673 TaxID=3155724 RepID=UPI0033E08FA3